MAGTSGWASWFPRVESFLISHYYPSVCCAFVRSVFVGFCGFCLPTVDLATWPRYARTLIRQLRQMPIPTSASASSSSRPRPRSRPRPHCALPLSTTMSGICGAWGRVKLAWFRLCTTNLSLARQLHSICTCAPVPLGSFEAPLPEFEF